MDNQSLLPAIWIAILAAACLTFFIYLLFFDKDDSHDVEIDNIYRRLEDNSKIEKSIQEELDRALTTLSNEFIQVLEQEN